MRKIFQLNHGQGECWYWGYGVPTKSLRKLVDEIKVSNGSSKISVKALQRYLFERLRTDDRCGILQLFIAPPGNRNCVIRAWWTPPSLRIEQRANTNDLRYTASACMSVEIPVSMRTHTCGPQHDPSVSKRPSEHV